MLKTIPILPKTLQCPIIKPKGDFLGPEACKMTFFFLKKCENEPTNVERIFEQTFHLTGIRTSLFIPI